MCVHNFSSNGPRAGVVDARDHCDRRRRDLPLCLHLPLVQSTAEEGRARSRVGVGAVGGDRHCAARIRARGATSTARTTRTTRADAGAVPVRAPAPALPAKQQSVGGGRPDAPRVASGAVELQLQLQLRQQLRQRQRRGARRPFNSSKPLRPRRVRAAQAQVAAQIAAVMRVWFFINRITVFFHSLRQLRERSCRHRRVR